MSELEVWRVLAGIGWGLALFAILVAVMLLRVHAGHVRRAQQQVDMLLLLGKSTTPGEAVAAVEKLARLERARDELMAQRDRPRARGQDQGPDVARSAPLWRKWFGHRSKPPKAPTDKGG